MNQAQVTDAAFEKLTRLLATELEATDNADAAWSRAFERCDLPYLLFARAKAIILLRFDLSGSINFHPFKLQELDHPGSDAIN